MIRIKDEDGKVRFILPDNGEGIKVVDENDQQLEEENEDEETGPTTDSGSDTAKD